MNRRFFLWWGDSCLLANWTDLEEFLTEVETRTYHQQAKFLDDNHSWWVAEQLADKPNGIALIGTTPAFVYEGQHIPPRAYQIIWETV